ncbi:hypothetical protein I204_06966 [Kwoniella mangroviensis CBS 8886]|nr:hypothetical protein I204_06966 [Kwoniella mangroviensis CBS 8886]
MAYFETPDRVLKRVQQLEDMELPSLPSFQHDDDVDFDSMSGTESTSDDHQQYYHQSSMIDEPQSDMTTPHPLRKVMGPPPSSTATATTRSSADSFSTASGSPFPPIDSSPSEGASSPYAPTTALTSTPQSHQTRSMSGSLRTSTTDRTATTNRTSRHERTLSGTGSLGNSTHASRCQRWQTPGEMSRSFSGEEIVDRMKLGAEQSIPLNDYSDQQYDESHSQSIPELPSLTVPPEETPVTRRLSSGNVLLERPRRRGPSAAIHHLQAVPETPSDPPTPATRNVVSSQASVPTTLPVSQNERIPSLSRSEVSATDVSEAASTPEGPVRNVSMMTPRADAHQEYEITGEYQYEIDSAPEDHGENPTWEYNQENEYTAQEDENVSVDPSQYSSPHKQMDTYSPARQAITPSIALYSTPGTIRGQPFRYNNLDASSAPSTILYDVTDSIQNTPSGPVTPSPFGMISKTSDMSNPRAPLDDAERRKSHVLAVLGSSSGPSTRIVRPHVRGTPHPLRRVSTAPDTESIAEEGSDVTQSQKSIRRAITPGMTSRLTVDQSVDQSFVSIASSADLTSDKRASHMHSRLSRGNTSFPTILLPTNHASPGGGSLKGLSDQRADGIKIHKHLNAMNKQLLETNADLAREAEAWRDEADRLRGILEDHGIDVEDNDVLGGLNAASTSANVSQQLPEWPTKSPNGRDSTKGDHSELISQLLALSGRRGSSPHANKASTSAQDLLEGLNPEEYAAVMQEMAEKLDNLEEGLNEKDQLIAELEEQLERARQANTPEQQGLLDEIEKLSAQLEEAERARVALHSDFSTKTEQHAQQFGEICSGFEKQVRSLEKDLSDARTEVDRVKNDKSRLEKISFVEGGVEEQHLRKRVSDLEEMLQQATTDNHKQLIEVESLKKHSAHMLEEKEGLMHRVEDAETEFEELRARISEMQDEGTGLESLEAMKGELKIACEAQLVAEDKLTKVQQELAEAQNTISHQETEIGHQHDHIEELNRVIESREADLAVVQNNSRVNGEAEEELRHVQQQLNLVNEVLASKESEIESLKGKLEVANIATQAIRTSQRRSTSPAPTMSPTTNTAGTDNNPSNQDSFVAAMEERLDEAYREIGRLKHELNATPHRKSAVEVRDAKIQALEREKAALADRLASSSRSMTISASPAPAGVKDAGSPFKRPTPLVHRAIASLRTPKTPGPLPELSWLQTTIGDANEPILQAQLEYLQKELRDANDQLDHNFSRLEAAGLGGVALAEKLAAAEERIGELEGEIRTLVQRNKASLALVSAQKEDRERDNEGRMQKALEAVHSQMEQLKYDIANERSRLQRDNGRLQNLVSEMRLKSQAQVESLQSEMQRMAEKAEGDLKATRDDLSRVIRERDQLKKEFESRGTQIVQLERDIAKEQRAYESLSRRNVQTTQSAALQPELTQKARTIESLQLSLRDAQRESDDLRNALSQRTQTLEDTKSRLAKFQNERTHVMKELEEFERDLQTQRSESREFGLQLSLLKKEQNNASAKHRAEFDALERELKEARNNERWTMKDLNDAKRKYDDLESWRINHQCDTGLSQALIDQKTHFKTQSRSLASQIRYLKAKFTRESTFRNALALQKRYLLLLVGGMSLDQQSTLRAIAQMGYPVPEPSRPRRTFKAVALAVCSIIRARNTANDWKKEKELKLTISSDGSGERRRVSART